MSIDTLIQVVCEELHVTFERRSPSASQSASTKRQNNFKAVSTIQMQVQTRRRARLLAAASTNEQNETLSSNHIYPPQGRPTAATVPEIPISMQPPGLMVHNHAAPFVFAPQFYLRNPSSNPPYTPSDTSAGAPNLPMWFMPNGAVPMMNPALFQQYVNLGYIPLGFCYPDGGLNDRSAALEIAGDSTRMTMMMGISSEDMTDRGSSSQDDSDSTESGDHPSSRSKSPSTSRSPGTGPSKSRREFESVVDDGSDYEIDSLDEDVMEEDEIGTIESEEASNEYTPAKPNAGKKYSRKPLIRVQLSEEERLVLEKAYKRNRYPSRVDYQQIQKKLKWPNTSRVAKWFNNRRYADRTRNLPKPPQQQTQETTQIVCEAIEKEMNAEHNNIDWTGGDCDL